MGLFAALFLAVMYFCFLWSQYLPVSDKRLRQRLQSYAEVKKTDFYSRRLTREQHGILLGALKKVEAKNGTLFAALTFVAAATVALIASDRLQESANYAAGFLVVQIPFFWATLRGMRQIDQVSSDGKNTEEMQNDLKNDLLIKETCFRFSMTGVCILITGGILFVAIAQLTAG